MDFIDEEIEAYAFNHSQSEGPLLQELEKETYEKLEIPQMITGRIEGRFLKFLAGAIGARKNYRDWHLWWLQRFIDGGSASRWWYA